MAPLVKLSAVYLAVAGAYAIAMAISVHPDWTKRAEGEATFLHVRGTAFAAAVDENILRPGGAVLEGECAALRQLIAQSFRALPTRVADNAAQRRHETRNRIARGPARTPRPSATQPKPAFQPRAVTVAVAPTATPMTKAPPPAAPQHIPSHRHENVAVVRPSTPTTIEPAPPAPRGNGTDRRSDLAAAQPPSSKPFSNDTHDEHAMSAPGGFIAFEMHYPTEVRDSVPTVATRAQIDLARRINASVNDSIAYRPTRPWTIELHWPAYGDCKTYALTKRHILDGLGVPDGAFRNVIVNEANTEQFHMLLEMQTVDGVDVLDSLPNDAGDRFYNAADMPLTYAIVEYQAWGKPEQWESPNYLTSSIIPVTPWRLDRHATRTARYSRAYSSINSSGSPSACHLEGFRQIRGPA